MSARRAKKVEPKIIDMPVPEWLLSFEARAKSIPNVTVKRFQAIRSDLKGTYREWWLSIACGDSSSTISFFTANSFILTAHLQDIDPRELMARAQVVMDVFATIAPELVETFHQKKEAA